MLSDGDLGDGAGEGVVPGVVVVDHGGPGVDADVRGLAGEGVDGSHGLVDPSFGDLVAVDVDAAGGALAQASSVVVELEVEGHLARGQRLLASCRRTSAARR